MKTTSRKKFDEHLGRSVDYLKRVAAYLEHGFTVKAPPHRTPEQEARSSVVSAMGSMCDALDSSPTSERAAYQRKLLVGGVRECLCALACIDAGLDIPELAIRAIEHTEAARAYVGLAFICARVA